MGHIEVDHETGKLTIRVRMEGARTAHQDLKTLSGGERSFITICFLLALGRQLLAKFHCLDEFDVFMDSISQGVRMRHPQSHWLDTFSTARPMQQNFVAKVRMMTLGINHV